MLSDERVLPRIRARCVYARSAYFSDDATIHADELCCAARMRAAMSIYAAQRAQMRRVLQRVRKIRCCGAMRQTTLMRHARARHHHSASVRYYARVKICQRYARVVVVEAARAREADIDVRLR